MQKVWLILLIFLFWFLAGCQTITPEPIPTSTAIPPTPAVEPTKEVVAEVDHCVSCHTDKEQLISTAKPEELAEKESSGVG